jgi:FtsP/CotA-like multicopper oxidase with cupredoxin domain
MRVDLVINMTGDPGDRIGVVDDFYRDLQYRLIEIAYTAEPPLRDRPLETPIALPANTVPEPDIANAERHEVTLGGGMMGMMGTMGSRGMGGGMMDMRAMMRHGMVWAINGVVGVGHVMGPVFTLKRGRSCIIAMANDTAWHHPMHLHGHVFRVIARDGEPTQYREWQDTVLLAPRERVEIVFVADNPGDWMFHCHILEHQETGMMSVIRIA